MDDGTSVFLMPKCGGQLGNLSLPETTSKHGVCL